MPGPLVFARPERQLTPLQIQPRLASWMSAEHPDQQQLRRFLDHAMGVLEPMLSTLDDPLALRLDVGLPPELSLLDHRDLDNYLFPLTTRLANATKRRIDCVWATKSHAPVSAIGVESAVPMDEAVSATWTVVRTTASSGSTAYKEQVRAAVQDGPELPDGPVALQLSFAVGPTRNWVNLWKPTIDSLSPLLGSDSSHPWNPRDGRIVELGLHRRVEKSLGNDVLVAIAGTPASFRGAGPA
jgi:hypothetical protein